MRCCRETVCALRGTGPDICNAQAEREPVRRSLATDWCMSASLSPVGPSHSEAAQADGALSRRDAAARSRATSDPAVEETPRALRVLPAPDLAGSSEQRSSAQQSRSWSSICPVERLSNYAPAAASARASLAFTHHGLMANPNLAALSIRKYYALPRAGMLTLARTTWMDRSAQVTPCENGPVVPPAGKVDDPVFSLRTDR